MIMNRQQRVRYVVGVAVGALQEAGCPDEEVLDRIEAVALRMTLAEGPPAKGERGPGLFLFVHDERGQPRARASLLTGLPTERFTPVDLVAEMRRTVPGFDWTPHHPDPSTNREP